MDNEKKASCITVSLEPDQIPLLHAALENACWELNTAEYCFFKAKKDKTSVAMYHSGKLVIQGRGALDFVEFILEPLVLKRCLNTAGVSVPASTPAAGASNPFFPHAGIDESGKGDFFGPLVIACAYTATEEQENALRACGVRDSKQIKTDAAILRIASEIRKILGGQIGMVAIGPEAYNKLYFSVGNLNRLLAWGHARSLENLLDRAPDCPAAIADQFGSEHLIRNALLTKGRKIRLIQRTKAESDMAVGAASILARAEFVRRMGILSEECGLTLPRGAGPAVGTAAKEIVQRGGREALSHVAKMHFRTAAKILGDGSGSEN